MKVKGIAVIFLLIMLAGSSVNAQQNPRVDEAFFEAEYFMMTKDFADALPYYLGLYNDLPDNANLAYRIGLCYLNIKGKKNLAIDFLERASLNLTAKYRDGGLWQTSAPYEALYFLGDAYRVNYMFEKAKATYRRYRETLLPDDVENMAFVDQQIAACNNAPDLMASPVRYSIESLGNMINDNKDNFFPVVSSDGRSIAYMTSLKFYDAIMFARMVRGQWTPPVNITAELQSDGDHYVSCLSVTRGVILLSKDNDIDSDIWMSKFDGVRWEPVTKLKKGVNTKHWESHAYITEDGSTIIFASDRPGGFGGLDLYLSKIDEDGEWGVPVNMGPEINTPFNEDRPFLINHGMKLYFTSQGHYSMGGYDIFSSEKQSNGLWSKPANLGYPLNTPDDDLFFCPGENGRVGFVSLTRDDGAGKDDIYKIIFK